MEVTKYLKWPIGWLCDRTGKLSTSKIMAFSILAANVFGNGIGPLESAILITATFGYSAWKDFVHENKWTNTSAESFAGSLKHDVTEAISHNITEKRDAESH